MEFGENVLAPFPDPGGPPPLSPLAHSPTPPCGAPWPTAPLPNAEPLGSQPHSSMCKASTVKPARADAVHLPAALWPPHLSAAAVGRVPGFMGSASGIRFAPPG